MFHSGMCIYRGRLLSVVCYLEFFGFFEKEKKELIFIFSFFPRSYDLLKVIEFKYIPRI